MLKNSIYLLFKLFFSMGTNLYISRELLHILGVGDFGTYNVVYGSVVVLTILTGSLSAAVTRFMNYEVLDKERVSAIFINSLGLHILFASLIAIFFILFGNTIVNNGLKIDDFRKSAALVTLYCASLSFGFTLITVSFSALIIANEDIKIFSLIGLFEVALKLVAILLLRLIDYDKLIVYGALVTLTSLLVLTIYFIICKLKYRWLKYRVKYEPKLLKEMFAFIGWNSIGSGSAVLKDQGVNILVNIFFGSTVNAARAIAFQVSSAINSIISQMLFAVNPRMTRLIAEKKYAQSVDLAMRVSRYAFFFMLLLCSVIFFNQERLLKIWLINVPQYTTLFLNLILVNILIDVLSGPLITLMLATGNIRNYQIVVGLTNAINFPLSYIFLKYGYSFLYTLYVSIFISGVNLLLRFIMLKKLIYIDWKKYVKEVLLKNFVVMLICYLLINFTMKYMPIKFIDNEFINLLIYMAMVVLETIIVIFIFGFNCSERLFFKRFISNFRGI